MVVIALLLLPLVWLLVNRASYALNNSAVAASVVNFACAGSVKQNILIANAAVLCTPTYRNIAGTTSAGAQIFMPPGNYSWRQPIDSLAFVQAVSGQTALVTVQALILSEANQ